MWSNFYSCTVSCYTAPVNRLYTYMFISIMVLSSYFCFITRSAPVVFAERRIYEM